jgi:hypothetical protein
MKTIVFCSSLSDCKTPGSYINLSGNPNTQEDSQHKLLEFAPLFNRMGSEWFEEFSSWLGRLNCQHADLFWWAHTATAKNVLSSSLGTYYFQVRAVCQLAKQEDVKHLYVLGATPGQMMSIALLLAKDNIHFTGKAWRLRHLYRVGNNIKALAKSWLQLASVCEGFFRYRLPKLSYSPDRCLFTYMDGVRREGVDNYFGKLHELLQENDSSLSTFYLAYVYRPYRSRLRQLLKETNSASYVALHGSLRLMDYGWVVTKSFQAWWLNAWTKKNYQEAQEYNSVLREVFVKEIGGYTHNLLVYKAACRFMKCYAPKVLVYPYENKSLEKMLLLGVRKHQPNVKIVGYQHTSVTPRHSTLFFIPGEAAHTPLPDKIITVGSVTKNYLEKRGHYPSEIFVIGGALRQLWSERLPTQQSQKLRILLALSSSREELIQSVLFFKEVMKYIPDLELGIRPHVNFPISILPEALTAWLRRHVLDLSNTLLQDNLNWCNLTVYVSSTVALESLMRGKPVVNISIGDIVSPDPLIGEVPFHWHANTPLEMVEILKEIQEISEVDYEKSSSQAVSYVSDYLSPITSVSIKNFSSILQ